MVAENYFDTLSKFYQIKEYHLADWRVGTVETPSGIFNHYFKVSGNRILQLPTKDVKDQKEVDKLISQVQGLIKDIGDVELLKKEIKPVLKFNNVIFCSSDYHDWYKDYDRSLHSAIILFFPIFHCEFSGDESPNEFDFVVRYIVHISDWKREAAPRISMKFNNPTTGVKTKGKNYAFVTEDKMQAELDRFKDDKAVMELLNWLGEKITIHYKPGKKIFEVSSEDGVKEYASNSLKKYLDSFFCH